MSGELSRTQQIQVGKAADAAFAAKMELDAAMSVFEAACVTGDSAAMVKRGEALQAAAQNWLDKTASKYEIVRRITYGL